EVGLDGEERLAAAREGAVAVEGVPLHRPDRREDPPRHQVDVAAAGPLLLEERGLVRPRRVDREAVDEEADGDPRRRVGGAIEVEEVEAEALLAAGPLAIRGRADEDPEAGAGAVGPAGGGRTRLTAAGRPPLAAGAHAGVIVPNVAARERGPPGRAVRAQAV